MDAERAKGRVRKLDDRSLVEWMDAALSGMQRHLDQYRMTGEIAHMHEVSVAEVTMAAVVHELLVRDEARRQEGL